MTEPVAYMLSDFVGNDFTSLELPKNPNNPRGLYFKEQLHARVKMTKKQLNAFTKWNKRNKLLSPVELIWNVMGANEYPDEFGLELQEVSRDDKYLLSLANIWSDFNPESPEKTIEIVPNMKWFVRSKNRDDEGDYAFLSGIETPDDWGYSKRHDGVHDSRAMAHAFETQEEAERWKNPLTEAVQLPVEDE